MRATDESTVQGKQNRSVAKRPDFTSVGWSEIQSLFAKARSDVLILLDTCAAASSTMRSQYGTMEAIGACGFESRDPPPGEYSFSNPLIEVLDDWISKRSFSASCLQAEILFQLKLKETKEGGEGKKSEWCTTPIHINYSAKSTFPGIEHVYSSCGLGLRNIPVLGF
jgi:hypothetical protein